MTRPLPCYHTWPTDLDADHEIHRCTGLPSCHPAPCQCGCGAEDYCTLHRSHGKGVADHRAERPGARGPKRTGRLIVRGPTAVSAG